LQRQAVTFELVFVKATVFKGHIVHALAPVAEKEVWPHSLQLTAPAWFTKVPAEHGMQLL
jgi:hypothetical protein